jgi:antitoxin (DNA-binding transcriptional repressor) of toxin-antitoxin stability system
MLKAEVNDELGEWVDQCQANGPVVITRHGKPVALLLAPNDPDDLERLILAHAPKFQALLERSMQSIREGKGLSRDEFWKAAAERRAQSRKRRAKPRSTVKAR